ncbi:hypothetical protein DHEL01_v208845 [Diaporthe helianthi]|uniref:Uncharacterized protein n=1 Tax=Diaporthe helianthi TaxID=158607 RepID=A0A2P5HR83_DIAHE|nr:hypothetical protein DHEL01_v208845 [Diaporthe helianthi]
MASNNNDQRLQQQMPNDDQRLQQQGGLGSLQFGDLEPLPLTRPPGQSMPPQDPANGMPLVKGQQNANTSGVNYYENDDEDDAMLHDLTFDALSGGQASPLQESHEQGNVQPGHQQPANVQPANTLQAQSALINQNNQLDDNEFQQQVNTLMQERNGGFTGIIQTAADVPRFELAIAISKTKRKANASEIEDKSAGYPRDQQGQQNLARRIYDAFYKLDGEQDLVSIALDNTNSLVYQNIESTAPLQVEVMAYKLIASMYSVQQGIRTRPTKIVQAKNFMGKANMVVVALSYNKQLCCSLMDKGAEWIDRIAADPAGERKAKVGNRNTNCRKASVLKEDSIQRGKARVSHTRGKGKGKARASAVVDESEDQQLEEQQAMQEHVAPSETLGESSEGPPSKRRRTQGPATQGDDEIDANLFVSDCDAANANIDPRLLDASFNTQEYPQTQTPVAAPPANSNQEPTGKDEDDPLWVEFFSDCL